MQTVALEPSSNTHLLVAPKIEKEEVAEGVLKCKIEGEGAMVQHGEHGTFSVESPVAWKVNQQEVDPISESLRPAFD
jgi:hypothetical protein